MGGKSDREKRAPPSSREQRSLSRRNVAGVQLFLEDIPRNLSDSGRPEKRNRAIFVKSMQARRGAPSVRKTVLVAKKRIKIQALEGDPMVGCWPSVRMNPDPRDKMEEGKELSVCLASASLSSPSLAVAHSRNRAITFLYHLPPPLYLSICLFLCFLLLLSVCYILLLFLLLPPSFSFETSMLLRAGFLF